MPIQSTDTTNQITFDSDFESWLITAAAHVVTSGQGQANSGVLMSHVADTLTNLGAIACVADAVQLDGSGGGYGGLVTNGPGGYISSRHSGVDSTQDQTTVINDGVIDSYYGVSFEANLETIENSGQIHASQAGVYSSGLSLTVENSGEISGGSSAIDIAGAPGNFRIINSGSLTGDYTAIASEGGIDLHNTGSVHGDVDLSTSSEASVVTNRGLIDGAISFGSAGDSYDGRGGTIAGMVSGAGGTDTLVGGAGDDTLSGGSGGDRLDGGKGSGEDTFVYSAVTDSTPNVHDVIARHWGPSDVIDLSALDANRHAAGNQDFAFAGLINAGDPVPANAVAYYQQGANTVVVADVNGDGNADFEVVIHGTFTLTAGEFVL